MLCLPSSVEGSRNRLITTADMLLYRTLFPTEDIDGSMPCFQRFVVPCLRLGSSKKQTMSTGKNPGFLYSLSASWRCLSAVVRSMHNTPLLEADAILWS